MDNLVFDFDFNIVVHNLIKVYILIEYIIGLIFHYIITLAISALLKKLVLLSLRLAFYLEVYRVKYIYER
jgi:hypothetical protein